MLLDKIFLWIVCVEQVEDIHTIKIVEEGPGLLTRPATGIKGCRGIRLDKHTGIRQVPWVRAFRSKAVLQYVPIPFYRHIPSNQ